MIAKGLSSAFGHSVIGTSPTLDLEPQIHTPWAPYRFPPEASPLRLGPDLPPDALELEEDWTRRGAMGLLMVLGNDLKARGYTVLIEKWRDREWAAKCVDVQLASGAVTAGVLVATGNDAQFIVGAHRSDGTCVLPRRALDSRGVISTIEALAVGIEQGKNSP